VKTPNLGAKADRSELETKVATPVFDVFTQQTNETLNLKTPNAEFAVYSKKVDSLIGELYKMRTLLDKKADKP
jgi:hypothetical protein